MSDQIILPRIRFQQRYDAITPEYLMKGAWVSTALALILTLPTLVIFIGLYYSTGNLAMGAIIGFSLHFVTLAFIARISRALEGLFD